MVVKIQPAAKSIANAVDYNERKADGVAGILDEKGLKDYLNGEAVGHVVATVNVPDVSTLENEFVRLKLKNERSTRGRKMEAPAFHMSINPGENDLPMDENTLVAFTRELMGQLGYGDNPYRIYRHDDTGRTHYHVVSTRIGQDGKKIKDSFENARCENICRGLAAKYGYVLGLQEEADENQSLEKENRPAPAESLEMPLTPPNPKTGGENIAAPERERIGQADKKKFVPPFKLDSQTPATAQYTTIHAEAMTWHFTTPEQYEALLRRRFNTEVKLYNDEIYYIGLDDKGNSCTPPVESGRLGITALRDVLQRCADTDIKTKKRQRERLENLVAWAAGQSEDWKSYRRLLERKGVYLVISWTADDKPFGVTWIDRGTKCIWKGSETSTNLEWLKETCAAKGWTMTRDWKHERGQRPQLMPPHPAQRPTDVPSARRAGSLSTISMSDALKELMTIHGVTPSRRSNEDASKGRRLKYGEEDDKIDIII